MMPGRRMNTPNGGLGRLPRVYSEAEAAQQPTREGNDRCQTGKGKSARADRRVIQPQGTQTEIPAFARCEKRRSDPKLVETAVDKTDATATMVFRGFGSHEMMKSAVIALKQRREDGARQRASSTGSQTTLM